jgi:hypothetical protein
MKVLFIPGSKKIKELVPSPARSVVPEWYKDILPKTDPSGVKKCVPFLDALTSGYIQRTWTDILVTCDNGEVKVETLPHEVEMVKQRENTAMPSSEELYQKEFIWQRPWSIQLPDGYSSLITHPLNRADLPFYTMSGIVDSDTYHHTIIGNIPFYIKSSFTGVIKAGTPMFQVIPIKREDWSADESEYDTAFWQRMYKERHSDKKISYKKNFWRRKHY